MRVNLDPATIGGKLSFCSTKSGFCRVDMRGSRCKVDCGL